jgi:hypothetical protein
MNRISGGCCQRLDGGVIRDSWIRHVILWIRKTRNNEMDTASTLGAASAVSASAALFQGVATVVSEGVNTAVTCSSTRVPGTNL